MGPGALCLCLHSFDPAKEGWGLLGSNWTSPLGIFDEDGGFIEISYRQEERLSGR